MLMWLSWLAGRCYLREGKLAGNLDVMPGSRVANTTAEYGT